MTRQKSSSPTRCRRIASPLLITPEGKCRTLQVVELHKGIVSSCRPLTEELPFTEWIDGKIQLKYDLCGKLRAYHGQEMIE